MYWGYVGIIFGLYWENGKPNMENRIEITIGLIGFRVSSWPSTSSDAKKVWGQSFGSGFRGLQNPYCEDP